MSPTPEQSAREEIDRQLQASGWIVQDMARLNIAAGPGVAVREFKLQSGFADYLLYLDQRAVGVLEAKPAGHTLTGVELQSSKYTAGLPPGLPVWRRPLPFAYESTGAITQFTSQLDPEPRSREVFTFHRPDELRRILGQDAPLRVGLRRMPALDTTGLWEAQIEAIGNREHSLAQDRPRALIQMATGSGKTFTAASFCYRLIKFAGARRILFLVDRNNLGKQTLTGFQQYLSPYTNRLFTEEYVVQRAAKNAIDPAAKVVITTIQRLYSMLKGEDDFDEGNEESSSFEHAPSPLDREPMPVVYSPTLPIEYFDIIVIDECHRSVYNVWRQVLEYFDAHLIGLTATPSAQTQGFFKGNLVQDYSHERAVADRVNVGCDVYRIRTQVSEHGVTVLQEAGKLVPRRDRRTLKRRLAELDADQAYVATQLNLDVVVPDQIRTVVRTFRDRLFTDIFPRAQRSAEDPGIRQDRSARRRRGENPARGIRPRQRVLRQDHQPDHRPQNGGTAAGVSQRLLSAHRRHGRHDRHRHRREGAGMPAVPAQRRIVGLFRTDEGCGVRVMSADALRTVAPDAQAKTHFVIVDAVGVCERDKHTTTSLKRKPSVTLPKLLDMVGKGMVHADIVSTLADRLARLSARLTPAQAQQIDDTSPGNRCRA